MFKLHVSFTCNRRLSAACFLQQLPAAQAASHPLLAPYNTNTGTGNFLSECSKQLETFSIYTCIFKWAVKSGNIPKVFT